MNALKMANLALAFLLELCALAAFAWWGYQTGQGTLAKIALAVGAPLVVAVFWGLFVAPRAVFTLRHSGGRCWRWSCSALHLSRSL